MDIKTLEIMRMELETTLAGKEFGKVFQLSKFEIAVDFRLADSAYLFVSVEPAEPRIYLVRRRLRDLDRQSTNPTPFALILRKRLSGAVLNSVEQIADERVLRLGFEAHDDLGIDRRLSLIAQLTGRSANLFLLDEHDLILASMRQTRGDGQQEGDKYAPPVRPEGQRSEPGAVATGFLDAGQTLSEYLDELSLEKAAEKTFQSLANGVRNKVKQEISKREKLTGKLNGDLAGHGNAERWKHFGDLLLANVSTAKRIGDKIIVVDYFDENVPELEIPADENDSITEAAEKFFRKYTKARNAKEEIEKRLKMLQAELGKLETQSTRIEEAISARDEDYLQTFTESDKRQPTEKPRGKQAEANSGTRSFVSSDGFEILVGKKAKDNDFLTFRIAKSLDLWMHAADYPGSHVVVRNPNRKEIPHQTLLEAAQLAAFYSQGKTQPKAAVHYTQKKFVNKPRGSAAGLVSLASFKTILVEPVFPEF